MVIVDRTKSPSYIKDYTDGSKVISGKDPVTGSDPNYKVTPLLTVGDEIPLLEGEFGNYTISSDKTFALAGIPDGLGYTEVNGLKYVWVNHELGDKDTTDISSTVNGKVNGARVSLLVFDKDWNAIGGKNLIGAVDVDGKNYSWNTGTGNYEDAEGNILKLSDHNNFSRFCSGYLASQGFVDKNGNSIPIYFAPEEVDNGYGFAVTPDGTGTPIRGLGVFAKEQIYAPTQYRAGNPSGKTVLLSGEDNGDGELYMYVGEQTPDDPNGLKDITNSLYVLRLEDKDGNVYKYETMPENAELVAKWVAVPDDVTLNSDGKVLSSWVNGTDENGILRSTNFRRIEDVAEDPNNPGSFYFATTGRTDKNGTQQEEAKTPEEADNPYGKLNRIILNPNDPTADGKFEFLLEGGPKTGVSFDNVVVDSNGNVLIQEDKTSFGGDVLEEQQRQGSIHSYNIAFNEGRVGNDQITTLFEIDQNAAGGKFNTEFGEWESSGIIEVKPNALPGQSSYLFDIQAHTIKNDSGVYQGRYQEGGQLILVEPVKPASPGATSVTADNLSGDDIFFLGRNDVLVGAEGNDRFFVGEGGGNIITGGEGADQFWIANKQLPESANIITDFQAGVDVIGIDGLGIGFSELKITQNGNNAVVDINDRELAIFSGVNANDLSDNNFVFI
jgi:secreted PhoX family phosphatase